MLCLIRLWDWLKGRPSPIESYKIKRPWRWR
jgi:hypothetical protein